MALLEVSGLSKLFGGLAAVSELDFDIQPGELLSMIGPNGAGKTTLFNLLTGFYKPTSGTITFNGTNITGCKPYQVTRHGIGRTFQLTSIFKQSTVLENVMIGRSIHARVGTWGAVLRTPATRREEKKTCEKAREILAFVGLADKEDRIAGALTEDEYREKLERAGFTDIRLEPTRVYRAEDAREFLAGKGADFDRIAPLVDGKVLSAVIRATRP